MHINIEPFRIKSVEPIPFTTYAEREKLLVDAQYNVFSIPADKILIDLLTDSGTSAMSSKQWSALMQADESYAGASSYYHFIESAKKIFSHSYILPVHQGRAAEKILFTNLLSTINEQGVYCLNEKKKYLLSNYFFDTTIANINFFGNGTMVNLLAKEGQDPCSNYPFKGNMDIVALMQTIQELGAENIAICLLSVTLNSNGGQPVSMENIKQVSEICKKNNILFFMDACRFAENAYFIKIREKGYQHSTLLDISREMFSYCDGTFMSGKKDGLANMGGLLSVNDESLYQQCRNVLILTEGFETYGGMSGRDLEAMAQGFEEVIDEHYMAHRIQSIADMGNKLIAKGVPILFPTGGHGIYIDAKKFFEHIPLNEFPGQAFVCELYLRGGIRATMGNGSVFDKKDKNGSSILSNIVLVRLAIPRRVYTQSHLDYVVEMIVEMYEKRHTTKGYVIAEQSKFNDFFSTKYSPIY